MFCLPEEHRCHSTWRLHKTIHGRQNCDFLKVVDSVHAFAFFPQFSFFQRDKLLSDDDYLSIF